MGPRYHLNEAISIRLGLRNIRKIILGVVMVHCVFVRMLNLIHCVLLFRVFTFILEKINIMTN